MDNRVRKELFTAIEEKYGELTVGLPPYECIKVKRSRDPVAMAVDMHQNHYVYCLASSTSSR